MSGISSVPVNHIPPVSGRDVSSSSPPANSPPREATVPASMQTKPVAPPADASSPAPTKSEVNQALEDMIKRGQPANTSVQFSVDDKLGQVVIKVVDPQTNKVIKQFPAEAILKMREEMLSMDSKTPPAGSLLSEKI